MSACNRCGIGAWHPEARCCTFADCEIRQAQPLPAVASISGGRSLAGGTPPRATGGFVANPNHERVLS